MTANLGINELTVEFESSGYMVRPLDGLSFSATDGELVVLLGPSGCGKTTLISCMAALLTPESGRIVFSGQTVNELRGAELALYRQRTVGVVFQAFNLIPSLSARSNVMVPLRLAGASRAQARVRADALLDRVELTERAHHRPAQLSGGQQQRVAIARALVQNPPLVVADEPTAHLDHIQVEGVLTLLRELAVPGRIVVVATHDDRVTHIADRVVELVPHFVNADREPEETNLGAGEFLFQQGERGELIYFIESGRMDVFRVRADGTEEHLAEVGAGNYVGELGPILNLPRSASVRAIEHSHLKGYTVLAFRRQFPDAVPGKLSQRPAAR
jgi:putative ABC transport system ATP-binding protein